VFLVEYYFKKELFKTIIAATDFDMQHEWNLRYLSLKQFRHTRNVNILKYVHRSVVVTETCRAVVLRDWVQVCTSHWGKLYKKLECHTVVVTKQQSHWNCFHAVGMLFSTSYHQTVEKIITAVSGCL
jgi:hypothetical protein